MLNIILCDLKQEFAKKNYTLISDSLQNSINSALSKKEKVILFLNHLGYARRIICQDCGSILKCPNCFTFLSLKKEKAKEFYCFQCSLKQKIQPCVKCKGFNFKFAGFTLGKIIANLNKIYNTHKIACINENNLVGSNLPQLLQFFSQNDITLFSKEPKVHHQLIRLNAKINALAILNADSFLNLPDYTAGEKTYIMLKKIYKFAVDIKAQNFLIQTFEPKNYILQSFLKNNNNLFYQTELKNRRILLYPPFSKLIKLIYQNKNENLCQKQIDILFDKITKILFNTNNQITPPLPSFPRRVRGNFRWQMTIKVKNEISPQLRDLLFSLEPAWLIDVY